VIDSPKCLLVIDYSVGFADVVLLASAYSLFVGFRKRANQIKNSVNELSQTMSPHKPSFDFCMPTQDNVASNAQYLLPSDGCSGPPSDGLTRKDKDFMKDRCLDIIQEALNLLAENDFLPNSYEETPSPSSKCSEQ
jgi:hypothetical protein